MTTNTPPFFINIDKLIFNFNNKNIQFTDGNSFKFEIMDTSQNDYYNYTILVYHNGHPFGTISHENLKDRYNSQFRLNNRQLYIIGFSKIISQLFIHLNIIDYSLSTLENSINSNIDLVSKFYWYCRSDQKMKLLDIKKGYYNMSITDCQSRILNINHNKDTIYLKKKGKAVETRIENKTHEVQVKISRGETNKTYIIESYSTVLDTSRDIYRIEQTINFKKLRRETHRHCYVKLGNPFVAISRTDFKKLTTYRKKQYHLVDSQLPKSFDLHLLEDRDFLFSFFVEYSIFDYTRLLGTVKPQLLTIHTLRPMHTTTHTTTTTMFKDGLITTKMKTTYKDIFDISEVDLHAIPVEVIPILKKVIPIDFFT